MDGPVRTADSERIGHLLAEQGRPGLSDPQAGNAVLSAAGLIILIVESTPGGSMNPVEKVKSLLGMTEDEEGSVDNGDEEE